MFKLRTAALAALAAATLVAGAVPARAQIVIEDFRKDPTRPRGRAAAFEILGPGTAQFSHDPNSASRFPGDARGSLTVTYDSLEPTTRFAATFPAVFTRNDDFVFGAVLTIRPGGFAPDPFGFHPIAFSLFNSVATGDDRTGDLSDFRADTYDTVEFAWFPNVSPFFGGPFLSPDLFGERIDDDAFLNFAFASKDLTLVPGATYLALLEHDSAARTLTVRVSIVGSDGAARPIPGGLVVVNLSGITDFAVDSLGIPSYFDGFNVFSSSGRSLLATVDYDLIFCGPLENGGLPRELQRALRRLLGGGGRIVLENPPHE